MHTKIKFCMQNFFFGNCLIDYKIQFAVKKLKHFWGNFKIIFVVAIKKNASHTLFINGNCMISVFFDKKYSFLFSTIR